ncbi:MAG: hypothetical protein UU16_C0037G0005 [Candidatus Woesebacteria bacterium GW2011_GWA2_40_7]|uniref:C2H2-type domain-containing protein n=3 Tax=Candidatus Woeseibacteriota TaxID=1752722 RepID=A0A0G0UTY3_9BACT|nr:MAG: hypothetical protein UT17_C0001G0023 [Candidatus Woesebacteria bacterium GW2011_GWB1_39_10]KKR72735.1 MAG: hypothetical protein UU16_C0037G0005 [Candidatus Woesebacteria bacterium GW2011_GWA2_40_7]KKR92209.1 MAG: hypothetical protein UU42_C0002G0023 [Candidatus Woesebacteria bacterium GW2011_GWA1_41_13b]
MPFPERVCREEKLATFSCAACDKKFSSPDEGELHSKTGLHLVREENSKKPRYRVTHASGGHSILKGKTISRSSVIGYENGKNDSVCLCKDCHKEIHRLALAEAKLKGNFPGNATPPQILEEVTHTYIEKGEQITNSMPEIELAKFYLPVSELDELI